MDGYQLNRWAEVALQKKEVMLQVRVASEDPFSAFMEFTYKGQPLGKKALSSTVEDLQDNLQRIYAIAHGKKRRWSKELHMVKAGPYKGNDFITFSKLSFLERPAVVAGEAVTTHAMSDALQRVPDAVARGGRALARQLTPPPSPPPPTATQGGGGRLPGKKQRSRPLPKTTPTRTETKPETETEPQGNGIVGGHGGVVPVRRAREQQYSEDNPPPVPPRPTAPKTPTAHNDNAAAQTAEQAALPPPPPPPPEATAGIAATEAELPPPPPPDRTGEGAADDVRRLLGRLTAVKLRGNTVSFDAGTKDEDGSGLAYPEAEGGAEGAEGRGVVVDGDEEDADEAAPVVHLKRARPRRNTRVMSVGRKSTQEELPMVPTPLLPVPVATVDLEVPEAERAFSGPVDPAVSPSHSDGEDDHTRAPGGTTLPAVPAFDEHGQSPPGKPRPPRRPTVSPAKDPEASPSPPGPPRRRTGSRPQPVLMRVRQSTGGSSSSRSSIDGPPPRPGGRPVPQH